MNKPYLEGKKKNSVTPYESESIDLCHKEVTLTHMFTETRLQVLILSCKPYLLIYYGLVYQ